MAYVETTLGISPEVQAGINEGRYYRDGGVVRERGTNRLVSLLRDVDVAKDSANDAAVPFPTDAIGQVFGDLMPLALHAATRARSARMELALQRLVVGIDEVHAHQQVGNAKLDGLLLGDSLALVQRVRLNLECGDLPKASSLSEDLFSAHVKCLTAARQMVASPRAYECGIRGWRTLMRAALATGSLVVDLCLDAGQEARTVLFTREVLAGLRSAETEATALLRRPGSSFWIAPAHRLGVLELREGVRRLAVRHEALEGGLFHALRGLGDTSAVATAGATECGTSADLASQLLLTEQ